MEMKTGMCDLYLQGYEITKMIQTTNQNSCPGDHDVGQQNYYVGSDGTYFCLFLLSFLENASFRLEFPEKKILTKHKNNSTISVISKQVWITRRCYLA